LASTGWIFMKLIVEYFSKTINFIQVSFISDKIMGNLHEHICEFVIISHLNLLRMRNVSDKSCRENHDSNFVFKSSVSENCAVYETVWKNAI